MSNYQTAHYDLDESRGHQMVVLDTFKRVAESIENDIIPASREDVAISGIENPASSLSSSGNIYTTIPLRPVSKDVNFIYNNYLHGRFKITLQISSYSDAGTTPHDLTGSIDCAISQLSTATTFDRIQLLLGNTMIWQNQFQRQEAIAGFASLPQELIQTSPEYYTCSKALNRDPIPGVYIMLGSAYKTGTGKYEVEFIYDFTIDLSHLSPILSNMPFTLIESGDLRLRVFMDHWNEAWSITPLPSTLAATKLTKENFHVISPQPFGKLFKIISASTQAIATEEDKIAAGTAGEAEYMMVSGMSWEAVDMGLEIIQSNFSIKESSREAIKSYIASDNKLVIPTQTWSTALATNKPSSQTGEIVWQLSAYNIYLLAFLFPYDSSWSCYYPTPPLTSIDIMLNSKSVNYIPYKAIDGRVVKDTIQAFVNDDRYGANEMLLGSLNLPLANNGAGYDTTAYIQKFNAFDRKESFSPNMCVIAKGLSPPNCFEKGYCYASSNPQSAQIRFKYSYQTGIDNASTTNTLHANQSLTDSNAQPLCLALQDCCLVLNYNPQLGVCQSGSVIYAEPSVV